jgi:hypothetical protein
VDRRLVQHERILCLDGEMAARRRHMENMPNNAIVISRVLPIFP